MIKVQDILNINGIFQLCLGVDSREPLYENTLSLLDTANDDICVSNINR